MLQRCKCPAWNVLGFLLLTLWFGYLNGWRPLALLLMAAAVHESGHLLMLKLLGVHMTSFELSPLGVVIQMDSSQLSYPQELMTVLAGPAVNLLCGTIFSLLAARHAELFAPAGAHWVLGLFNLLPVSPLDGGRALRIALYWTRGPDRGGLIAAIVGAMTAITAAAMLLWTMVESGGNLWLLPTFLGMMSAGVQETECLRRSRKSYKCRRFPRLM